MSVLGQQLREARLKHGLSLADVEADIKIRQAILRALEEGNGAEFPPRAFARGLIRKYATYLELDPGWALELFEQEHGRVTPARFSPVLQEPLYRKGRDWSEFLLGTGVLILCAIVGVLVWQNSIAPLRQIVQAGPTPSVIAPATTPPGVTPDGTTNAPVQVAQNLSSPTPPPTAPPPTRTPVLEPIPVNAPPPTPTLLPTLDATATLAPPTPAPTIPSNEVEVAVEITQPSWLQVTVDGQQVFAAILQPGQNRAWRGQRSVTLRTGNAGGTIIFVNGQAVGTLGNPGAVVEREWQLGQGDVIMLAPGQQRQPTATPRPSQ
jgi:cytoskeleton protein RodZ